LAPPLDFDWLLHSHEGRFQGHLIQEFGIFFVSWGNMATHSPCISLNVIYITKLLVSLYFLLCSGFVYEGQIF
jgi:hypothetical protein